MDRVQFGIIPNLPLEKKGLCIAHSPVSNHLVVGTQNEITVFKTCSDKFKEEKRLKGHVGDVNSFSFSVDGKYLVSGGGDGTVRIWDFELGECIKILGRHKSRVISCKFSGDGREVVSLDENQIIKRWELSAGGGWTLSFEFHVNGATDCRFNPEHEKVISVWKGDNGPALHNSRTGKYIGKLKKSHKKSSNKGGFSFDGKQIVVETCAREPGNIFDCLRKHLIKFYGKRLNNVLSSRPPSFCSYDSQILSTYGATVRIMTSLLENIRKKLLLIK